MMAGLKHLRHRRHEVILMHVLDPAEVDFPFEQLTLFRGLEELADVLVEPRPSARPIWPSSAASSAESAGCRSTTSITCRCGPISRWRWCCRVIWRRG